MKQEMFTQQEVMDLTNSSIKAIEQCLERIADVGSKYGLRDEHAGIIFYASQIAMHGGDVDALIKGINEANKLFVHNEKSH